MMHEGQLDDACPEVTVNAKRMVRENPLQMLREREATYIAETMGTCTEHQLVSESSGSAGLSVRVRLNYRQLVLAHCSSSAKRRGKNEGGIFSNILLGLSSSLS